MYVLIGDELINIYQKNMSEKKELSVEELEKVAGGTNTSKNKSEITWKYELNRNVNLSDYDGSCYSGTVKKKGTNFGSGYYFAVYYIEFSTSPENNGWFLEDAITKGKYYYKVSQAYYSTIDVTEE